MLPWSWCRLPWSRCRFFHGCYGQCAGLFSMVASQGVCCHGLVAGRQSQGACCPGDGACCPGDGACCQGAASVDSESMRTILLLVY